MNKAFENSRLGESSIYLKCGRRVEKMTHRAKKGREPGTSLPARRGLPVWATVGSSSAPFVDVN